VQIESLKCWMGKVFLLHSLMEPNSQHL